MQLTATGTFKVEWQCTSHCHSVSSVPMRYAQGRVAVQLTATGTLRVEWQCTSHCHSMVNVRGRYAQGRVAVQPVRSGSSGSAGRDGPKLVSATSASGCALSEAGPKPYRERPLREGESLCNWVDATGWPFCRLDGPLAGQADLLHMSIVQEPYRAQCWYSPCATQANRNARRSLLPVCCQLVQVVEVGVCHGRIGCGLLINDAR